MKLFIQWLPTGLLVCYLITRCIQFYYICKLEKLKDTTPLEKKEDK